MGDVEFGKCGVCKEQKPLQRKYYNYNVNCECCNGHFEYVVHCKDCTPVEPKTTRITMSTEILKKMSTEELPMAVKSLCKALTESEAYKASWVANIAMAFKDVYDFETRRYMAICHTENEIHKIANEAAERFINQLIK